MAPKTLEEDLGNEGLLPIWGELTNYVQEAQKSREGGNYSNAVLYLEQALEKVTYLNKKSSPNLSQIIQIPGMITNIKGFLLSAYALLEKEAKSDDAKTEIYSRMDKIISFPFETNFKNILNSLEEETRPVDILFYKKKHESPEDRLIKALFK